VALQAWSHLKPIPPVIDVSVSPSQAQIFLLTAVVNHERIPLYFKVYVEKTSNKIVSNPPSTAYLEPGMLMPLIITFVRDVSDVSNPVTEELKIAIEAYTDENMTRLLGFTEKSIEATYFNWNTTSTGVKTINGCGNLVQVQTPIAPPPPGYEKWWSGDIYTGCELSPVPWSSCELKQTSYTPMYYATGKPGTEVAYACVPVMFNQGAVIAPDSDHVLPLDWFGLANMRVYICVPTNPSDPRLYLALASPPGNTGNEIMCFGDVKILAI